MTEIKSYKWLRKRDKEILYFLYTNRFMNTSQIERLFFQTNTINGKKIKNKRIITNYRLRQLRDHKCIKSYYPDNNGDAIHTIDENGIFIVAAMMGKAFNDLYFNPKNDLLSYSMAEHCLMLTDVYIKLLDHAEKLGGKIQEFKVEQLNQEEFYYRGKDYILRPDIFVWYKPDKNKDVSKLYYIEVDNGTETPGIFANKAPVYEALFGSGVIQKRYSGLFPQVITICNDTKRINKLKAATKTKLKWTYLLFDEAHKLLEV